MENKELINMFSSLLDEKLQPLNERLERLEGGQQVIIEKLDNVSKQVASNTENQTSVESMAVKVAEHDTDIKLLKKFITN
ncbi:hypothetical protein [Oceanobacillus halophilus]|uniref:Uncharacterized protein n=1 Tax=Oceanobacillus halophilus TaxID=930130 RepID=A0A494ZSK7_9BACI|nr:hypothetical protein [Oceanobacillus halophilus]RKQ28346.1 hypothetical protein D8M06_19045 [Oceanobacillus halophilus]